MALLRGTLAGWARVEHANDGDQVRINARRIYILPTRYGIIFAVLVFLMLLGAVNYGNNPGHLLTFVLAATGINTIYLTWRNLRALRLRCLGSTPIFAGQAANFVIELQSDERERPAIQLGFEHDDTALLDVPAGNTVERVELAIGGFQRGEHLPGRLVISTQYPFGLFRAWCYIECTLPVLVYPAPGPTWQTRGGEATTSDDGGQGVGNDDFAGLRNYVPGDQPSRIDWKSYARDRGLNTRLFSGQAESPLWIDWHDAPAHHVEARLSALCRAVLDAEAAGQQYGLRTPEGVIEPNAGPTHRYQCLRHLARFGNNDA